MCIVKVLARDNSIIGANRVNSNDVGTPLRLLEEVFTCPKVGYDCLEKVSHTHGKRFYPSIVPINQSHERVLGIKIINVPQKLAMKIRWRCKGKSMCSLHFCTIVA